MNKASHILCQVALAAIIALTSSCKKETNENTIPTVSTTAASEIKRNSAIAGGDITDDGGSQITSRGVCWSINENPTISNNKTENGSGKGKFISTISNLKPKTTYYLRAYAINNTGIAYGNTITFTTQDEIPLLTTTQATDIKPSSAISGGEVSDDGGLEIIQRGVCWSTNQLPTTNDNSTSNGSGTGSFESVLFPLEPKTNYYVRAYAINSAGIGYGETISFTTPEEIPGTVSDIDGNVYPYVNIGTQIWMAKNLKTTRYHDGTPIPTGHPDPQWGQLTTGAYSIFSHTSVDGLNSDAEVLQAYGALYNWYAVETNMLCPTGWKIPSQDDWDNLIEFLGGTDVAGGKLKSTSTAPDNHPRWDSPNTNAADLYGFAAEPGGWRFFMAGGSYNIGLYGYWWSSNEKDSYEARLIYTLYNYEKAIPITLPKVFGISVRCIKDN